MRLSVVIPTFGRQKEVQACVTALLAQEKVNLEIMVIDQNDGNFLSDFLPTEIKNNIQLVQGLRPNVSLARNEGFRKTTNELILFIDDDLLPGPNFCWRAIKVLEENTEIDALAPLIELKDGSADSNEKLKTSSKSISEHLYQIPDTISAAFFIRRKVYEKVGGFDPHLFDLVKSTEDKEFFTRMNDNGFRLFLDTSLKILHLESQEGGCELRQTDYWINREKFIKGWFYIQRKRNQGRPLSLTQNIRLFRSAVFNLGVLRKGTSEINRNIDLWKKAKKWIDSDVPGDWLLLKGHLE